MIFKRFIAYRNTVDGTSIAFKLKHFSLIKINQLVARSRKTEGLARMVEIKQAYFHNVAEAPMGIAMRKELAYF